MKKIPVEKLRTLLRYEPETGLLFWLERPREMFSADNHYRTWNTRFSGKEALTARCNEESQYLHGHVLGVKVRAHRVAWAIAYGAWPDGEIDHVNGNPSDNRLCNLRVVSHGDNCRNLALPTTNTSGVVGVSWIAQRRRWQAQIWKCGKVKNLGRYASFDEAVKVRREAELRLGYHQNHGKRRRLGGAL